MDTFKDSGGPAPWIGENFEPSDLESLSEFLSSFPGAEDRFRRPGYYNWKYRLNPQGESDVLLAKSGGRIVGTLGAFPMRFYVMGKPVRALHPADILTCRAYRGQGIFSTFLKKICKKAYTKGPCFIYGPFPTRQVLPLYVKQGFALLRRLGLRQLARPLNARTTIGRVTGSPSLGRVVGPFVEWGIRALASARERSGIFSGVEIREMKEFPEEVENLFHEVRSGFDVILDRSRAYLNWRFRKNPETYTVLEARDKAKKLAGYLVYKVDRRRRLRIGRLVDYLARDEEAFRALLDESLDRLKREGADLATCWTPRKNPYGSVLRRRGFLPQRRVPVVLHRHPDWKDVFEKKLRWHFTMADSDIG